MPASKPEYLEKAAQLTDDEKNRVLSRMRGKLPRRLEKDKLSREEAIATQLELEDEQLSEWLEKVAGLRKKKK